MKKPNTFPVILKSLAFLFGILTLLLFWCSGFRTEGIFGALAITALTCFYHFAMRLVVGTLVPNHFDPQISWFRVRDREQKFYKAIHIKKWKRYVPTWDPRSFSLEENTLTQILAATCHAEVVHEVIVVLSFLPLLFSLVFGEFFVFFFTSAAAAACDSVFVMLQRSNRPRLQRLLEKQFART